MKLSLVYFIISTLFSSLAYTQTNTWTGATDTDWHKACNWSLGVVPICGHDVIIPDLANDPDITNIAHCRTIAIQGNAIVDLNSSGSGRLDIGLSGGCSGTAADNGGCGAPNCTTWSVDYTAFNDMPGAVVKDATGLYVVGSEGLAAAGSNQWRMEKRDLVTGAILWNQNTTFTGNAFESASAVAVDGTGVYVTGRDYTPGFFTPNARIEKRNLSTGALIWSKTSATSTVLYDIETDGTNNYSGGIDTNPLLEKRNNTNGNIVWSQSIPIAGTASAWITDITLDGSFIYINISAFTTGYTDGYSIVQKRNQSDGNLVWSQTVNPYVGTPADGMNAIAVDGTGVYLGGKERTGASTSRWYMQKRNLSTGALLWTQTSTPSVASLSVSKVEVNGSGAYFLGTDFLGGTNYQWRVEKRNLSTGALVCTQSTNPGASYDFPGGLVLTSTGYFVVGGKDVTLPANVSTWYIENQCTCP